VNKGDVMKWLLIAGAAYLVYRYLQQSGFFTTAAAPAVGAPGTDAAAADAAARAAAAAAAGGNAADQVVAAAAATPTIAQALAASVQAANYDPYASYNGFQWNWFWQRTPLYNGVDIGPTELGISDTATVPLAAAVTAIRSILGGVAGLASLQTLLASPRMLSAWSM
jgi:hypothetical protein